MTEEQKPEVIQLSPAETQLIMNYAVIRNAAETRLTEEQWAEVYGLRDHLYKFMTEGGDAAKVALQLFVMEFNNEAPPYGDTFTEMKMLPWEEAIAIWQRAYAEYHDFHDNDYHESDDERSN